MEVQLGNGNGFFYTTSTSTRPKLEHFRYEWKLENFSKFYQDVVETFIALCHLNRRFKWSVKLYPKHTQPITMSNPDRIGRFILINIDRQNDTDVRWKNSDGYRAKITLLNGSHRRIQTDSKCLASKTAFGLIVCRDAVLREIRLSDTLIVQVDLEIIVQTVSLCSFIKKADKLVNNDQSDDGSDVNNEDDWVLADVAETSVAAPDFVLKEFDSFCAINVNCRQTAALTSAESSRKGNL
uniref:MATH domain-containing protein n=1 Tax=Syphacia muris TaxID=451379 RepID=A0A158R3T6_9BILA